MGTGSSGVRGSLLPKGEGLGEANLGVGRKHEWGRGGLGAGLRVSGNWGLIITKAGGLGEGSQRRRGGVLERSRELPHIRSVPIIHPT